MAVGLNRAPVGAIRDGLRPVCKCVRNSPDIHMRTNIVIDDKLMADVLKATGAKTRKEAVELVSTALSI